MKLDIRQEERLVADHDRVRLVLFYGPDTYGVVHHGRRLARRIAGSLNDPFQVSELTADQVDCLPEEATASSFGNSRRVVLFHDAADGHMKYIEAALAEKSTSLIIALAGDLSTGSTLRKFATDRDNAAAIACYLLDEAARSTALAELFRSSNTEISREALAMVSARLGGDTGTLHDAAERLILFAGKSGKIDTPAVDEVLDDQGSASMQQAIDAALAGDLPTADRILSIALDDGAAPIAIIRMMLNELGKLRLLAHAVASGAAPRAAIASARPPIFFRRLPLVTKAVGRWLEAEIMTSTKVALQAELACKQTGAAPELICRQLILAIASGRP